MTTEKCLEMIQDALQKVLERKVDVSAKTDLAGDKILDSLDGFRFIFELEELSSITFPQKDLEEENFFKVEKLIAYMQANAS